MRMTKLMGLAILIVALAAAINALAFQNAVVTNGMSFTVSNTNAAGLAFDVAATPGSGVNTSVTAGGELNISLSESVQPNSVYRFIGVFKVSKAGTTASTTLSVDYTNATAAGVTVEFYRGGGTFATALHALPLNAGLTSTDVDMQITVPSGVSLSGKTFTIPITGATP